MGRTVLDTELMLAIGIVDDRNPDKPAEWRGKAAKRVAAALKQALHEVESDYDQRQEDPLGCLPMRVPDWFEYWEGHGDGYLIFDGSDEIRTISHPLNIFCDAMDAGIGVELVEEEIHLFAEGECIGYGSFNHRHFWPEQNASRCLS